MLYEALILLPNNSNWTAITLAEALAGSYRRDPTGQPSIVVSPEQQEMRISWQEWSLYLRLAAGGHIREEGEEIMTLYSVEKQDTGLIPSDTRLELNSDPDDSMDHFNDYILSVERLINVTGGIAFEPGSMQFL